MANVRRSVNAPIKERTGRDKIIAAARAEAKARPSVALTRAQALVRVEDLQREARGYRMQLSEFQARAALSQELGTSGLQAFSGYIREAYTAELYWPQAYRIYNDMRRRVPVIRALLNAVNMLAHQVKWKFDAGDIGKDEQGKAIAKQAADFGNECISDMGEAFSHFVEDMFTALVFGFAWAEENYARRNPAWRPPDPEITWRSRFTDDRVGWRNFAFRRQYSWLRWDMNDANTVLKGMWQLDPPNPEVLIPLNKSIHYIPFRDGDNPEGFSLMESAYEAYYYLKNYSIILGVGMERSLVGWPVFSFTQKPSSDDIAAVAKAAGTLLAGAEKGYLSVPPNVQFAFETIGNPNAPSLIEIIRYYNLAILQTLMADFIYLGSGPSGSFALGQDKSQLFIMAVNGLLDTLADTLNAGPVKRLFNYNQFQGLEEPPRLTHSGVHKPVDLSSLAQFVTTISQVIPLSEDDQINIRKRSDGLLSETTTHQGDPNTFGMAAQPPQPQLDANGQPIQPQPQQPQFPFGEEDMSGQPQDVTSVNVDEIAAPEAQVESSPVTRGKRKKKSGSGNQGRFAGAGQQWQPSANVDAGLGISSRANFARLGPRDDEPDDDDDGDYDFNFDDDDGDEVEIDYADVPDAEGEEKELVPVHAQLSNADGWVQNFMQLDEIIRAEVKNRVLSTNGNH